LLSRDEILELFQRTGVLMKGHFLLSSGLHSPFYLQCARIQQYPQDFSRLCAALARPFRDSSIEVVVGPAIGAIILSYEMARQLEARCMFAEREEGKMVLRRGFFLKPGERVLVVEDVVTTGGSAREVVELVKREGALPIGVAALVDRSEGKASLGTSLKSLIQLSLPAYHPQDCPLCRQGVPLVKPGSKVFTY